MTRRIITLFVVFACALGTISSAGAQLAVTRLQPDGSPAAADFNAQKGKSRLLIVLSPT